MKNVEIKKLLKNVNSVFEKCITCINVYKNVIDVYEKCTLRVNFFITIKKCAPCI